MEDVKNLARALLLLYGLLDRLEPLYNASMPFVDVHIVGAGGSNYFPLSYSGSNRGGGCKKCCQHFSSYMAYIVTRSLHVHIRRGGRIQLFSIEL
jgi:hypothetical protein